MPWAQHGPKVQGIEGLQPLGDGPAAQLDPPWCLRAGHAAERRRRRAARVAAAALAARYGGTVYWPSGLDMFNTSAGGDAAGVGLEQRAEAGAHDRAGAEDARDHAARAFLQRAGGCLGGRVHVEIAERVRRLNVGRLARAERWGARWECPFGAGGCDSHEVDHY
jgi:hypothetical protein